MTDGAGVPPAAGVVGLESEALSPLEVGAACRVADVAGDSCDSLMSLAGDSSLTDWGSMISRSLPGETVRVTRPGLPLDFRRTSLDLLGGAMAVVTNGFEARSGGRVGWR